MCLYQSALFLNRTTAQKHNSENSFIIKHSLKIKNDVDINFNEFP